MKKKCKKNLTKAASEPASKRRGAAKRRQTSARARFDNASHPGRRSPVREALRLPDELEGGILGSDGKMIGEGSGAGKRSTGRPEGCRAQAVPRIVPPTRGVLAGTGPLTRWPRPEEKPPQPKRSRTQQTGKLTAASKLDPWAEDEPIFGQQEIAHALSPTPGTPPHGNLAVSVPEPPAPGRLPVGRTAGADVAGRTRAAQRAASQSSAKRGRRLTTGTPPSRRKALRGAGRAILANVLSCLRTPIRVEIELEHCGRWTCGLAEKASPSGLEISLGHRSVGTRDFLAAGRLVLLLVSPHGERPFQIPTKILWVDPPSGPGRAVRAQLVVVTKDAGALAKWRGLVERSRG